MASKPTPRPRPQRRQDPAAPVWLYGRHAVLAALNNKARHQHKLLATKNALDWLAQHGRSIEIDPVKPEAIDKALPTGAVHQGLAIKVNPLPTPSLKDAIVQANGRPFVVLDQVTDPQNIGTIFRTGTAFGAAGVIVQDRRTPPPAGALAKASAGTIEITPMIRVVNIARALDTLSQEGYATVGLAGEASQTLRDFNADGPLALVLGAEGAGLRPLVQDTCTQLVRIPMSDAVESLNVATAAGIALYALTAK
ncbi:MAG: 23S rRNA (guanosine(2251)-2'-O)-methyltransferase RlmB [Parvularcula sp.]